MTFSCPSCNCNIEVTSEAAGMDVQCPQCSSTITVPHPGDFAEPLRSDAEPKADTKKCPYCAETILKEAIKCRYCGSDLVPALRRREPATPVGKLLGIVLAAVLVLALVAVVPPFVTLKKIELALERGDGDALSKHIDFPRLRENLKHQFTLAWMEEMSKNQPKNKFETAGAAIGMALGGTLLDRMLDTIVSPSGVAKIFEYRKVEPVGPDQKDKSVSTQQKDPFADASYSVRSLSEFVVAVPAGNSSDYVHYVFTRTWLSWHLTNIKLPLRDSENRAEVDQCVVNLKRLMLAVRMWANDRDEQFPSDYSVGVLKDELGYLAERDRLDGPDKPLECPTTGEKYVFEIFDKNLSKIPTNSVCARCLHHDLAGLVDGSIWMEAAKGIRRSGDLVIFTRD